MICLDWCGMIVEANSRARALLLRHGDGLVDRGGFLARVAAAASQAEPQARAPPQGRGTAQGAEPSAASAADDAGTGRSALTHQGSADRRDSTESANRSTGIGGWV